MVVDVRISIYYGTVVALSERIRRPSEGRLGPEYREALRREVIDAVRKTL